MSRASFALLALLSLGALGACYVAHVDAPSPHPPGPPVDPAVPPDASGARVVGTIEVPGSIDAALAADGAPVGVTSVLAGGSKLSASVSGPARAELFVYGPASARGFGGAPLVARGTVYVDVEVPVDGTYLFAVRDPAAAAAPISIGLACASGECKLECGAGASCPAGAGCALVQCIRAPCPSYCVADADAAAHEPAPPEPGPTGGEGATCGTRGAPPCADGLVCIHPEGASCGDADAPGACETLRRACTREYAPVCGCDARTYPTACTANAAGVSVRHRGECTGSSPTM